MDTLYKFYASFILKYIRNFTPVQNMSYKFNVCCNFLVAGNHSGWCLDNEAFTKFTSQGGTHDGHVETGEILTHVGKF